MDEQQSKQRKKQHRVCKRRGPYDVLPSPRLRSPTVTFSDTTELPGQDTSVSPQRPQEGNRDYTVLEVQQEEPITLTEEPLSPFRSYFEPMDVSDEQPLQESLDPTCSSKLPDEAICDSGNDGDDSEKEQNTEAENTEPETHSEETTCDPPLYAGAPNDLTLGLAMLLIVSFATRHELTGEALSDLLLLMNTLLPLGSLLSRTLWDFRSYFSNLEVPIVYHGYCSFCYAYLENDINNKEKCCPNKACLKDISKKGAIGYFIEVPIACQIVNFFKREGFLDLLQHRFKRVKRDPLAIEDIYDGKIYSELFNQGILSNPNNISLMFNTDGASVFKSSKLQMWPIFMTINELSPSQRVLKENMILAGLWYGDYKPPMWTFLKPTMLSLKELEENGIEVESGGSTFRCFAYLIAGTFDLPARALVCNSMQFNGENGCWKCLEKGKTVKTKKGGCVHAFPFADYSSGGIPRTKEMVYQDAIKASQEGKHVNGIKGPNWLLILKHFDCVRGVAIDYMHGILQGITKTILKLLFSKNHKSEAFNISKKVETLDKRLVELKPPFEIKRKPRPVSTHLAHWKATELRTFLLFYAAPCLYGLVEPQYLEHLLLLSHATYLLSMDCIMPSDLETARKLLKRFCEDFSQMYNPKNETLNVHQLVHLVDDVEDLGPLFTHSLFSFEDKNKFLLSLIHGTTNIQSQISYAVSLVQNLPVLEQKMIKPNTIHAGVYRKLTKPSSSVVARKCEIEPNIWVLGGTKRDNLTSEESEALCLYLQCRAVSKNVLKFQRALISGKICHSKAYSKARKSNTYTVMYSEKDRPVQFGHITCFFQYVDEDEVLHNLAAISCLEVAGKIAHISRVCDNGTIRVTAINQIKDVCVFLHVNTIEEGQQVEASGSGHSYVLTLPNRIEKD